MLGYFIIQLTETMDLAISCDAPVQKTAHHIRFSHGLYNKSDRKNSSRFGYAISNQSLECLN